MIKKIKELYKEMPLPIQNLAITLYNIYVLNRKFSYIPLFNPMAKITRESQDMALNLTKSEILLKINRLISYAKEHTLFYRKRKYIYDNITDLKELEKIPILYKAQLRRENQEFFSDEINSLNSISLATSGTTGTPIKIKVRKKDLQLRYKLLLKALKNFGIDISRGYARFIGHDIFNRGVYYRRDFINNHLYLSIFDLSAETLKSYVDTLKRFKIKTLEGYPSVIYTFAKLLKSKKITLDTIENVITTAEKLHPYQKALIEEVFGSKVFDYYGSNEQSILIYTCREGRMHIANATGYLEVVDSKENRVENGEEGGMVITSFTSYFMPLIRYKIGDNCVVSKEQSCSCGEGGIILDEILGRDEDIFMTNGGKYITRVSLFLKEVPDDVVESQLIFSNSRGEIKLKYISEKSIESSRFKPFISKLKSVVGNSYDIKIERVPQIGLTKNGKRKAIKIED
jgi:phenylacetate-CoA ligase